MNEEAINFEDDIISVEVESEENVDTGEESILSKGGRFLLYTFLALFPVWFLPTAIGPVELNKAYFGLIVLLASFMLSLGGMLQEGRVRLLSSRFYLVYFLFALVWLLASLFSSSPLASLWGFGLESATFVQIITAGVGLFVTTISLRDSAHIRRACFLLLSSISVVALFFFVQSVFGIDIFKWSFSKDRSFNPFGGWTSVAAFLGLGVVMSVPILGKHKSINSRMAGAMLVLFVIALFFTNVVQTWIAIAIVSLFFVALSLSQREQRSSVFGVSLFLLLAAVLFSLLSGAIDRKLAGSFDRLGRPQEAVLTFGTTMKITRSVLAESPVFGSGPNTFGLSWDRFKDPNVNSTIFWQARFTDGYSFLLTLLSEVGIAGFLAFLLLFLVFVWQGVRGLTRVLGSDAVYLRSIFAGGLYLFLLWFLIPLSQPIVLLTFIFSGLFLAVCADLGVIRSGFAGLFETRERGFVFSLLIIFMLVGSVGGVYFATTRYLAALAFGRGVATFNATGAVNQAENEIVDQALALDTTQDRYYQAYAQFEYIKIQRALNDKSLDQKTRQERFQDAYQKAVAAARTAVDLGKSDAVNYRTLGQVYEVGIPIDPNIADLALENYEKARTLSPSDPLVLVDIARTHLAVADVTLLRGGGTTSQKLAADRREKAVEALNEAVKLKPDYTQAYFTLAQLYVAAGKLDEAISNAEATTRLVPNNVGVLFQLGLLYYRKENYNAAQTVLEKTLSINPDYSNAKYFLGLIYDRAGKSEDALKLFREIAAANPDNEEVKKIVTALESGKKAADALSQPPPEKRTETPVPDPANTSGKTPKNPAP